MVTKEALKRLRKIAAREPTSDPKIEKWFTGLPKAYIIDAKLNPFLSGALLVKVNCPYCGEKHNHGVPAGHYLPAARVQHCSGSYAKGRDYQITLLETL